MSEQSTEPKSQLQILQEKHARACIELGQLDYEMAIKLEHKKNLVELIRKVNEEGADLLQKEAAEKAKAQAESKPAEPKLEVVQ